MSELSDLEAQLKAQQADYLKRLEGAGQLPSVVSEAWQKAGGEETKKLRGEEAGLLTDYVSAGARGREKYKDIWDPFQRDVLASQQTALSYKPIGDIRSELAMRAEALGVATSSAQAMYGAGTQVAETNLGFTQSAYDRALERERNTQQLTAAKSSGGGGGGGGGKVTQAEAKNMASQDVIATLRSVLVQGAKTGKWHQPTGTKGYTEKVIIPQLMQDYPMLSRQQIIDLVYNTRKGTFGF